MADGIDFNVAYGRPSPIAGLSQGIQQGLNYGMALQEMRMKQQAAKQEEENQKIQMLGNAFAVWKLYDKSPEAQKDYYEKTMIPLGLKLGYQLPKTYTNETKDIMDQANGLLDNFSKIDKPSDIHKQALVNGLNSIAIRLQKVGSDKDASTIFDLAKTYKPNEDKVDSTLKALEGRASIKLANEKPKALGSLNNTLHEYDNMIAEAEAIKNDKSLGYATGIISPASHIPGTGAKRVAARLETLKAKTLLNVLSSLKTLSVTGASGFGQLSNIEGEQIRNSISTLDPTQSKKDLQESIDRFIVEMKARKENLKRTFEDTYGIQGNSDNRIIEDGYEYLGGDKKDPRNWRKI